MTSPRQQQRQGMSIGSVLDRLRPEFPDVTISKIRFLESEGLLTPERTASGYRRFSVSDCERLRFVLTAQRDRYLPLKVIKEQLDALDSGSVSSDRSPHLRAVIAETVDTESAVVGVFHPSREVRVSREDLVARSGASEEFVAALIASSVVTSGPAGFFDEYAITLVRSANELAEFGLEPRHLRAFRSAAEREAGLIAQIVTPVAKSRDSGARDRADDLVREVAALSIALHSAMVKSAVRSALDR
ncbi:MAG: transcriptional regulator FtsR [Mycobacteriaceae bacterium]